MTISCPGQDPAQRYRRDAVDYALISLRIAIERAPLARLDKLSLSHMHAAGFVYLRHMPGFGCTPSAGRRWKQIKKLNITMDSWDFQGLQPGLDHLKVLDDYIRSFSSNLEKVSFGWNGRKGPCPFTLFTDPLFALPRERKKLFAEVTSPMSPLPAPPARPAMSFPNLRYMQVRNASMSSEQVADFVFEHRHTVKEFDFENVFLINGGTWEDALAPLTDISGSDEWQSQQSGSEADSNSSGFQSHEYLEYLDQLEEMEREEVIDTLGNTSAPAEAKRNSVHVTKLQKKTRHRRRRRKHRDKTQPIEISAPMPISEPVVDFLQPTVFNPNVQGVQRNVQQDRVQQELADDPEKRVSTLKKAREAVLKQLSKEFCRGQERKDQVKGFFKNTCSAASRKDRGMMGHQSSTALVPLMFSRY